MCRKAAQLYREAGRGSAAAEALSKAAKLIEDKNPQVTALCVVTQLLSPLSNNHQPEHCLSSCTAVA